MFIMGENVQDQQFKSRKCLHELNIELPYDSVIPLLGECYPGETKMPDSNLDFVCECLLYYSQQPQSANKCPLEWVNKMYILKMEYCLIQTPLGDPTVFPISSLCLKHH